MAYTYEQTLNAQVKKLKKSYPHKSKEELLSLAEIELKNREKAKELDIQSYFDYKEERKIAEDLLVKYFRDYTIESVSDRNTLIQLIYLEVIQHRLQSSLNEFYKNSKAVPKEVLDSIHKIQIRL